MHIFASDILIGSVIIMLCAVRATSTFESAVYSVVTDNFGFDKNGLPKSTIMFLPVITGFLVKCKHVYLYIRIIYWNLTAFH